VLFDRLNWLILLEIYCHVKFVLLLVELRELLRPRNLVYYHVALKVIDEINLDLDHALEIALYDILVKTPVEVLVQHQVEHAHHDLSRLI